jgi:hypothetical protein
MNLFACIRLQVGEQHPRRDRCSSREPQRHWMHTGVRAILRGTCWYSGFRRAIYWLRLDPQHTGTLLLRLLLSCPRLTQQPLYVITFIRSFVKFDQLVQGYKRSDIINQFLFFIKIWNSHVLVYGACWLVNLKTFRRLCSSHFRDLRSPESICIEQK